MKDNIVRAAIVLLLNLAEVCEFQKSSVRTDKLQFCL